MNDVVSKILLSFLTDERLKEIILPFKRDILAKLEAYAKESPEVYDDIAFRILRIALEG